MAAARGGTRQEVGRIKAPCLPKPLKPFRIQRRIPDGILNLPVPKVILNEPKITPLVREVIPASVPELMRVRLHW